jgi:hypothetical protein
MASARQQLMAAQGNERFPTEWALYDSDEQEGEQVSHQSCSTRRPGADFASGEDRAPGPPVSET